jgi:TRAP-type uncharacterized transport system fused permease subunit
MWGMFGLPGHAAIRRLPGHPRGLSCCCSSTADLRIGCAGASDGWNTAVLTAARQVSMIAAIILCASIIIGVLAITGLGVKITSLILSGSGGCCGHRCC